MFFVACSVVSYITSIQVCQCFCLFPSQYLKFGRLPKKATQVALITGKECLVYLLEPLFCGFGGFYAYRGFTQQSS